LEVSPPTHYTGLRALHMVEGGREIPTGMPAIMPPIETVALPMTESIQRMSYALMLHFAPNLPPTKWRALHGYFLAMNNGAQNGFDGGVPHADFINGRDVTASLPRYDKMQRCFQGSFIRGEPGYSVTQALRQAFTLMRKTVMAPRSVMFRKSFRALAQNNILRCRPDVHGIDATKPLPSIAEIVAKNWYVTAVTAGNEIHNFPQGDGATIVYPFIFDREITFPLEWFEAWDENYLPNPLEFYR
jgi:hypothetical protein